MNKKLVQKIIQAELKLNLALEKGNWFFERVNEAKLTAKQCSASIKPAYRPYFSEGLAQT